MSAGAAAGRWALPLPCRCRAPNQATHPQSKPPPPAAAHNAGAGGLLEWQARRERRAVAEAAPEQRLYVSLYRSLDKLAVRG